MKLGRIAAPHLERGATKALTHISGKYSVYLEECKGFPNVHFHQEHVIKKQGPQIPHRCYAL